MPKASQSAWIVTGTVLILISLASWLAGLFGELPDGGEFAMTAAIFTGVVGPLLVFVSAVTDWRRRMLFSLATKLIIGAAVASIFWNVGFWVLFLFAYRDCPGGVC